MLIQPFNDSEKDGERARMPGGAGSLLAGADVPLTIEELKASLDMPVSPLVNAEEAVASEEEIFYLEYRRKNAKPKAPRQAPGGGTPGGAPGSAPGGAHAAPDSAREAANAVTNAAPAGGGGDGAGQNANPSDCSPSTDVDYARLVTGEFKPRRGSDQRNLERFSFHELGAFPTHIRLPERRDWLPVKLWDFSSIGFGVVISGAALENGGTDAVDLDFEPARQGALAGQRAQRSADAGQPAQRSGDDGPRSGLKNGCVARASEEPERHQDAATSPGPPRMRIGDEIAFRLELRRGEAFETWCRVRNFSAVRQGVRLGLRRLDLNFPRPVALNRRDAERLVLGPGPNLYARLKHPLLFDRWCRLKVVDINHRLGLAFLSNDPSLLLFEGMEVDIHFELHGYRHLPYAGRVAWVQATREDEVKFGLQCLDIHYRVHNALCDFLIDAHGWTPARLFESGFRSRNVRGHLRFRCAKNMEDYARVLRLRRDAYVRARKVAPDTPAESMASALDGCSRILCAYHGEKLVGTVTFAFPKSEETRLDSEAGFPGGKYPVPIPPKTNLIEVSRLCLDPEYRGTDLLQGLFEQGLKHFLLSERHWLLTSAVEDLLPLYRRIGFVGLDASYRHPFLNNREHHLIICHRSNFIWGMNMSIVVWNAVFGDIIHHMHARGLIRLGMAERWAVRFQRLFRGPARLFLAQKAYLVFRRHLDLVRTGRA